MQPFIALSKRIPQAAFTNSSRASPQHLRLRYIQTMSSTAQPTSEPKSQQSSGTNESKTQPLALPESSSHTTLDLSSGEGTVKLDALGPMVVNHNGTLSRIENWDQMSEIEQQNTLRVLNKRNKARLAALREKGGVS